MKTKLLILMNVVLLFLFIVGSAPSTLTALAGIEDAITSMREPIREWHFKNYKVQPEQNNSLFTVPSGQEFVIRRIHAMPDWKLSTNWHLAEDDDPILDGCINFFGTGPGGHVYHFTHDFLDGCLIVGQNRVLNAANNDTGILNMTIVGYFRQSQQ